MKHIGKSYLSIEFLSKIYGGLQESFPQVGNEHLFYYLYSKPGVN